MSVANCGHLFAIRAASSGLTPAASISEIFSGMTQVYTVCVNFFFHTVINKRCLNSRTGTMLFVLHDGII